MLIYTQQLILIVFYEVFIVSILKMKKLRFKEVILVVSRDGKWQRKDLVDRSFYHYVMSLWSLLVVFVLKSTLSDINTATLSSFKFTRVCVLYLFPSFYFQPAYVIILGEFLAGIIQFSCVFLKFTLPISAFNCCIYVINIKCKFVFVFNANYVTAKSVSLLFCHFLFVTCF